MLAIKPVANLTARLDAQPLDAQEATAALLGGRSLWRITVTSASPARPAELSALRTAEPGERPYIVQEHACAGKAQDAASRPRSTPRGPVVPVDPPVAPRAASRPFSGRLTGCSTPGSAPDASQAGRERPSDGRTVPCSTCGTPIALDAPEEAVLIHLGATLVDCFHAGECPRESEGFPDRSA